MARTTLSKKIPCQIKYHYAVKQTENYELVLILHVILGSWVDLTGFHYYPTICHEKSKVRNQQA